MSRNESKSHKVFFLYSDPVNERFIEQLVNSSKFCISCGELCDDCRLTYGKYADDISGMLELPQDLPAFLDDPDEYLPVSFPKSDYLVVFNIHHDILTALPELLARSNIPAVIIPVEDGDWVPKGLENQIIDDLESYGIQYAFPRPYCALDYSDQPLINEFIDYFKIGKPVVDLTVINNRIINGVVKRTSPCGCMFYVNREILRYNPKIDDKLKETISKAHHAYPCNASMNKDVALNEAPLHIGGYIHRECIYEAIAKNDREIKWNELSDELEHLKEILSYEI